MKTGNILFSAPMARSVGGDFKSETRRMVKPQPVGFFDAYTGITGKHWLDPNHVAHGTDSLIEIKCPHGQPGDRLRVKEAAWMWCEKRPNGTTKKGRPKWHYVPLESAPVYYVADQPKKPQTDIVSPETGNAWGWRFKVGRFLPAWASRDTLGIVSVRIERLQDITDDGAMAEGITEENVIVGCHCAGGVHQEVHGDRYFYDGCDEEFETAVDAYQSLWKSINGAASWEANPWVWVIEFKRVERGES